jgi:hypothetical protein
MNFDLGLIDKDNLSEEEKKNLTPYQQVEAAKDIYGWPFKRLRGIDKLVALFKKYFLTTFGSDDLDPEYGSYVKQMIGRSYSNLEEIADDLQNEVERVEEQILRVQTESFFEIPAAERLKAIELESIYEDNSSSMWRVNARYKLINFEGDEYEGELLPTES